MTSATQFLLAKLNQQVRDGIVRNLVYRDFPLVPDQHLLRHDPLRAQNQPLKTLLNIPLQRRFSAPTLCCRHVSLTQRGLARFTKQRFEFISLGLELTATTQPSGVTLSMGMGLGMAFFQSANAMISTRGNVFWFFDSAWHTNTRLDAQPTDNKLSAV